MPRVFPFQSLTYDTAVAGPLDRVTAPPYDVISEARRREFLGSSPYSVVHLDLAEGSDDPAAADSRYARAAHLLTDWEARGALRRSREPGFLVYEMSFPSGEATRRIRGLFVGMVLEDWGGMVVPHEHTMPGPVEDRLRLLRATRTHLSAIYGTIEGPSEPLAEVLAAAAMTPPGAETIDEQGVTHRMWPLAGDIEIGRWLVDKPLLIADGHHRYTTALTYGREVHARRGPGPWDRVLTLVVDSGAEHLPVLPFHRIQRTGRAPAGGGPVADLAAALAAVSDDECVVAAVTRGADGAPAFQVIRLLGEPPAVRALHEGLLDEEAADEALRFTPSPEDAVSAVVGGEAVAAWLLPPTTPDRIRKVIERGERLPRKSTYFWPKPRTGMVMMPIDERAAD